MHSSKLIQILKKFTEEEIENFKKYLNTPAIKNDPGLKSSFALFKIIAPQYPHFKTSKIKKESIFNKLYPEQVYKVGRLEKRMGKLFGLVQKFIVFQYSGSRRDLHELLTLSSFYQDRALFSLAKISINKYQQILQQNDQRDSTYLYDVFLLEKQIANDQAILQDSKKILNFPQTLKNLDQYYIFEKLELACRILAIHRFLFPIELEKSLVMLEYLLPLLESDFFESPVIKVFYKAYCFLNEEGEENFHHNFARFEKALKLHHKSIPENQVIILNTIIRNYYISQYLKGREGFLEKSFYVYKDHLEKGYLYHEGLLFDSTMINMVVSGLLLKEYDWVIKFIKEHEHKIKGTSSPEEVYRLNLANYYFHIVEYDKALDYLTDNFEDIYIKLRTKRIEIKIYYEMKHALLGPRMDAFKIYTYRLSSNITKKQKEGNRNFIDILRQINLSRTFQNEKRIQKLIDKINGFKYITEKEWLLEKLESLR